MTRKARKPLTSEAFWAACDKEIDIFAEITSGDDQGFSGQVVNFIGDNALIEISGRFVEVAATDCIVL